MGWVRLDDQFFWHRKVVDLSAQAKLLFVVGLTYSAGQMTDGFLSQGAVKTAASWAGVRPAVSKELVEAGLWHKLEGGYQIHDYLDYQPSAAEERERKRHLTEVRAAAGRKGGVRSGQSRRGNSEANGEAKPKQTTTKPTANREAPRSPEPLTTSPSRSSDLRGWCATALETESENLKATELTTWLWEAMPESGRAKVADVGAVVCWAMQYLDAAVVEEAIGYMRSLADPPRSARYVATTLRSWATQRGVEMPEWRAVSAVEPGF